MCNLFKIFSKNGNANSFLSLPFHDKFMLKNGGYCFVNAEKIDNKIYIHCAQPKTMNNSITNAIEDIAQQFSSNPKDIVILEDYSLPSSVLPRHSQPLYIYKIVKFNENFEPLWGGNINQLSDITKSFSVFDQDFCKIPENFE
ncbi:hypothetical protein HYE60_10320 [Aggregatibacter actinomycetemcomitans]|uniref:hypothetical protein n=1 Tax=Aggregatibacter actinomycetemcomitans TaxID=714 RepID=UPI00197B1542|nr:hypothetical protein [Aggregatibacter actinomycetemcomitans]MBN6075630.1 hypothetical protein [Aggregatibacter actinomycetemcomitans]